jgi:hypothetical protein
MWQDRNYTLHHVHNEADTRLTSKLDQHIRREFTLDIDKLAPIHHYMLRCTRINHLLLWDNAEKQAWLATIQTAQIAWCRRRKRARLQRRALRDATQQSAHSSILHYPLRTAPT